MVALELAQRFPPGTDLEWPGGRASPRWDKRRLQVVGLEARVCDVFVSLLVHGYGDDDDGMDG